MRWSVALLLAVLLIAVASVQALAQYEDDRPGRVSVRVGVYNPFGSMLDVSPWPSLGGTYNLQFDDLGRRTTSIVFERASKDEGRFEGSMTALSYMKFWYPGSKVEDEEESPSRGFYIGAGAGIYALSAKLERNPYVFPPEDEVKHSEVKPGFSLLGGYNLSSNVFAELGYTQLGSIGEGADFTGVALYIGTSQLF